MNQCVRLGLGLQLCHKHTLLFHSCGFSCAHEKGGWGCTLIQALSPLPRTFAFLPAQQNKWERQMQEQRQVFPKQSHSSLYFCGKLQQLRGKKKKKKREREGEKGQKKKEEKSSCLLPTAGTTVWTATEWQSESRRLGFTVFIPQSMGLTTKAICPDPRHL